MQQIKGENQLKSVTQHPQPNFFSILATFVASGCYSGFSPKAPGTIGSAVFLVIWLGLAKLGVLTPDGELYVFIALFFLAFVSITIVLKNLGPAGSKDPQFIVIDEWLGVMGTLSGFALAPIWVALLGFVIFRLFDVAKPGPVRWVEKLPGPWGIMMDDIVAAVLAWATLQPLAVLYLT